MLDRGRAVGRTVDFLGATLLGIGRLARARSPEAGGRLVAALREAGLGSLPIVALMGLVAGLVATLIGSKELSKLGIEIGIPRLVGIAACVPSFCALTSLASDPHEFWAGSVGIWMGDLCFRGFGPFLAWTVMGTLFLVSFALATEFGFQGTGTGTGMTPTCTAT